jgi:hypothetical protein
MAVFPGWKPTYQYWGFLIAAAGVNGAHIPVRTAEKDHVHRRDAAVRAVLYHDPFRLHRRGRPHRVHQHGRVLPDSHRCAAGRVFVLPFTVMFPMNAGLEALYVVLLWYNKDAGYARMDTFSSLAGFFFSIIVMVSVSNLRASEGLSKMRYIRQGTTDPLTQVLNRAECEERMREYFSYRRRNDAPCALLMFDIDNFKNVNDEYSAIRRAIRR